MCACAAIAFISRLQLQWPYDDWLAQAAGADVPLLVDNWRPKLYAAARVNRLSHPEDYRDRSAAGALWLLSAAWLCFTKVCRAHVTRRWADAGVLAAAEEEFKQLLPQNTSKLMVC